MVVTIAAPTLVIHGDHDHPEIAARTATTTCHCHSIRPNVSPSYCSHTCPDTRIITDLQLLAITPRFAAVVAPFSTANRAPVPTTAANQVKHLWRIAGVALKY
ncbi:hypothetical protein [Streptomyces sp. NPDC005784]|uniref:hypothetical protein n=1 Tax=Streptomyces sp. NPDC005784 TaxID=3364731 RepID=UPI0036CB30D2